MVQLNVKICRRCLKKAKGAANNAAEIEYWDKRQLVKKINLNSLYGAILNPGCRFFDKRIGQSTTLTGRQIVKHMSAEANKVITGEYDHTGKAVIMVILTLFTLVLGLLLKMTLKAAKIGMEY